MKKLQRHQPGSSLVLIVVTMAAISMVMVTGSAVLLSGMRQKISAADSRSAEIMAERGIEEGARTYKQPNNNSYAWLDATQAFIAEPAVTAAENCTTAGENPCYEGVKIRNFVKLSATNTQDTSNVYTYTTRELPDSFPIWIRISYGESDTVQVGTLPLKFSLRDTPASSLFANFDYNYCYQAWNPATSRYSSEQCGFAGATRELDFTNGLSTGRKITRVQITMHYVRGIPQLKQHVPALVAAFNPVSGTAQEVNISKGFTTIEARGYSANKNAESRLLYVLRPFDRTYPLDVTPVQPTQTWRKIAQDYSASGFCRPSLAHWRRTDVAQVYDPVQAFATFYDASATSWGGKDDCR